MHEVVVPNGTTILISILNSNRDPAVWGPDACEWKPERWLSPLPDTVIDAPTPGAYSNLWVFYSFDIKDLRLIVLVVKNDVYGWFPGMHVSVLRTSWELFIYNLYSAVESNILSLR